VVRQSIVLFGIHIVCVWLVIGGKVVKHLIRLLFLLRQR